MYRDKKTGRWRVIVTVNGQRVSKLCASRSEAERTEYELKHGLVKADTRRESVTFKVFADRWHERYCKVRKAPSQWRIDRCVIDRHLLPVLAEIRLSALKRAHLVELERALLAKPGYGATLHPKTVNNVTGLAKRILAVAVEWDLLDVNPWASCRPLKSPERVFDYWTISEFQTFADRAASLNPLLTEIATVAFHTGLRAGELAGLNVDDVDFQTGKIRVRATRDLNTGEMRETTKSRRIRYVGLNRVARQVLERYRFRRGELVFPMDPFWNLAPRFRRLCRAAKVREMRFHDLRHSFASNLAMAGVPLLDIQREMGHQSYQMTLRYAHLHPDHGRGVTDVLCTPAAQPEEGRPKSGGPRGT